MKLKYPLAAFPLRGPATLEDWFPVDGTWHNVVYVFDPQGILPLLYVDGKSAERRSESALFDRCLSRKEIETLYISGSTTYHALVREMGGKFINLDLGREFATTHPTKTQIANAIIARFAGKFSANEAVAVQRLAEWTADDIIALAAPEGADHA